MPTRIFIRILKRAMEDDKRWPNIKSVDWLLKRASGDDYSVMLTIDWRDPF